MDGMMTPNQIESNEVTIMMKDERERKDNEERRKHPVRFAYYTMISLVLETDSCLQMLVAILSFRSLL